MADTIITKDGKRCVIGKDSHFVELLRDSLGDGAADWYKERVEDLTKGIDEIGKYLPIAYLNRNDDDALDMMNDILQDLRGWDG